MNPRKYVLIVVPVIITVLACTCSTQRDSFTPILQPTQVGSTEIPLSTLAPPPVVLASPTPLSIDVVAQFDATDAVLVNLYQRVNPGVVFIEVFAQVDGTSVALGTGSGFVIDSQGHIVTNNHVVAEADEIEVTFAEGGMVEAEIIGVDPYSDLAVIRVDVPPDRLSVLELGDSSDLRVGQRVIAIGNPFGLDGTMTVGIISALGRTLPAQVAQSAGFFSNPEIVQTDAAINPGNSGGPLLDSRGRVIGVNSAIRSTTGANSGVGFAVPVNTVKRVVPGLIENGRYDYPYLGITSDNRFNLAQLAGPLELLVTEGVLISEVTPGGAADQAGLQGGNRDVELVGTTVRAGGDILVAINDYDLRDFDVNEFVEAIFE
ncbi:MAG: trypsin-like peptidase domain-containing protein [Anaerolineae bacterium]|nr:trypsin-like peptidase domain-containing protein [Anaerolineae bacterium]